MSSRRTTGTTGMDAKGAVGMSSDPNVPGRVPSGSSCNMSIPVEPDPEGIGFNQRCEHEVGE